MVMGMDRKEEVGATPDSLPICVAIWLTFLPLFRPADAKRSNSASRAKSSRTELIAVN